ncbi:hypothetical protein [Caulobacter endophyticus]|uniref:Uncharacterized protein n=1 Tax=Caulobacter endophyticus TaxID=2172652 RepID=A0A2T9JQ01_9CAUL|nr:hypothetical protein [Caulobacter endophyticus]PVM85795.1 hypothetical protein DDF67_16480 [Caulobacter endophyticus]
MLAAVVQAAPTDRVHVLPQMPGPALLADAPPPPARIEDSRVIRRLKPGCALAKVAPTDDAKGANRARPLAREPRSALRYAVLRSIDGCPVDSPMRVNRAR